MLTQTGLQLMVGRRIQTTKTGTTQRKVRTGRTGAKVAEIRKVSTTIEAGVVNATHVVVVLAGNVSATNPEVGTGKLAAANDARLDRQLDLMTDGEADPGVLVARTQKKETNVQFFVCNSQLDVRVGIWRSSSLPSEKFVRFDSSWTTRLENIRV